MTQSQDTKTTSHSNPFTQMWQSMMSPQAFGEAMSDAATKQFEQQAARVQAFIKEFEVFEQSMAERVKANAEQITKLANDTLSYMNEMTTEYRKQMATQMATALKASMDAIAAHKASTSHNTTNKASHNS